MPEDQNTPKDPEQIKPPSVGEQQAPVAEKATGKEQGEPPETSSVPIRVVNATTNARVAGAVVAFEASEGADREVSVADEDGDLPQEFEVAHRTWNVTVFHRDFRSTFRSLQVPAADKDLDKTTNKGKIVCELAPLDDIDQDQGKKFFRRLCAALLLLAIAYALSHYLYPQQSSLAATLLEQNSALKAAVEEAEDTAADDVKKAFKTMIRQTESAEETVGELQSSLTKVREALDALDGILVGEAVKTAEAGDQAEEDKEAVSDDQEDQNTESDVEGKVAASVDSAANENPGDKDQANDRKVKASAKLAEIDIRLADLAEQERLGGRGAGSSVIWNSGAKWFLEVFFWAFAGILVRLIITVGRYLRRNRFYKSGVSQHIALLVVSPLLTLVYILLISMIRIESDAISLDLSNPRILAGISFLLAATPWSLWERLEGVAGRVLGEGKGASDTESK